MMKVMMKAVTDIFSDTNATLFGFIMSVFGYFLPVRDIVYLLLLFFILDVVFGYLAAKKLRGEKFSVKLIWTQTVPRMVLTIVLVLCSYMWDNVFGQEIVHTYKVIGWFIGGVLLYSIAQNGYYVTKWDILPKIGHLINKKVEENTGVNIDETLSSTDDKN